MRCGPFATDTRVVISQMTMMTWWPILIEALIDTGDTAAAATWTASVGTSTTPGWTSVARSPDCEPDWPRPPATPTKRPPCSNSRSTPSDPTTRSSIVDCCGTITVVCCTRAATVATPSTSCAPPTKCWPGWVPSRTGSGRRRSRVVRNPHRDNEIPLAVGLTEREQDVVALVRKGLTNREIAAEMYVSEKAVEYHLRNVYGKLGITSRRELRAVRET